MRLFLAPSQGNHDKPASKMTHENTTCGQNTAHRQRTHTRTDSARTRTDMTVVHTSTSAPISHRHGSTHENTDTQTHIHKDTATQRRTQPPCFVIFFCFVASCRSSEYHSNHHREHTNANTPTTTPTAHRRAQMTRHVFLAVRCGI